MARINEMEAVRKAIANDDIDALFGIFEGTTNKQVREEAGKGAIALMVNAGVPDILIEWHKNDKLSATLQEAAGKGAVSAAVKRKDTVVLEQMTKDPAIDESIRVEAGTALVTMYSKKDKRTQIVDLFRDPQTPRGVKDFILQDSARRKERADQMADKNRARIAEKPVRTFTTIKRVEQPRMPQSRRPRSFSS